jgi:hypothetical protein
MRHEITRVYFTADDRDIMIEHALLYVTAALLGTFLGCLAGAVIIITVLLIWRSL